jgi:hypothetical protein
MALQDELTQEQEAQGPAQGEGLTEEEQKDLRLGVLLAEELIDSGGIDVITQAVEQSRDPAQVIGQFLMQLAAQLDESLPEQAKLSKKIYLVRGGWVEQISDYLQEEYGISREVMDRAEIYIGTTAQEMAANAAPPPGAAGAAVETGQPQAGGPAGAVMPQGVV